MFDDAVSPGPAPAAAAETASSTTAMRPVTGGSQSDGAPAAAQAQAAWTSVELTELVARLASVALEVGDAERIDQLTALERVKAACAAAQARITDRFVDSQAELARHWHAEARARADASDFDGWCAAREQARRHEFTPPTGREDGHRDSATRGRSRGTRRADNARAGVAAQVALARHESPAKGTRLVSTALALTRHLPHTLAALSTGLLNEHRAALVARHTSHLTPELAAAVDAQVIGTAGPTVGTWGDRELERHVRACADRLDPAGATARARTAESDRRVTLRPIPDTMALLTAVLPVAQAVAVHAALARAAATAKAAGDPRSTGQLMADTLVALVTGQEAAADVPIEVQVILTDRALLGGEETPAHIPGYGPVPAAWARHLLSPDDLEDMLDDLDHADTDDMDRVDTEQLTDDMDRANTEQLTDDVAHPHNLDPDGLDHDSHIDLDDLDHDSYVDLGDAKPTDVVDLAGARQGAPPRSERSDYASPVPPPDGPPLTEPLSSDRPPGPPPPVRAHPTAPPPRQSRRAQTWLRRLYTHPGTGTLITMDSRRRLFDAGLRRYLIARDGVCRTPWCDAPIRHLDHIHPHADGGPTTASNGQGLCVRCNLVKDQPGFNARVTHAGPTPSRHDEVSARDGEATARPHTVQLTTPTGHTYTSTAPPVLPCLDTPPQPEPRHAVTEPASASTSSEAVVIEIYPRAHSVIEYDATHLAS